MAHWAAAVSRVLLVLCASRLLAGGSARQASLSAVPFASRADWLRHAMLVVRNGFPRGMAFPIWAGRTRASQDGPLGTVHFQLVVSMPWALVSC